MLKAKNLLYIKQLKLVLAKLVGYIKTQEDSKLMHFGDYLMEMDNFDNVNLFKLIRYIEKSKICHKLQSYTQSKKNEDLTESKPKPKGVSSFLNTLKKPNVSTYFPNILNFSANFICTSCHGLN